MSVEVMPVQYQPHHRDYALDIEILDAEELRERVAKHPDRGFERVDFQCFLFVQSGSYTHTIDFETHTCGAGSCLLIGPGQVHRFGPPSEWSGWMLIVGTHHVPEMVASLPTHVRTDTALASTIAELFTQLLTDAALPAGQRRLAEELLKLQTEVLVRRLALGHGSVATLRDIDPVVLERYRDFRNAVDQHHRNWHQVADYALHLACSTKSLNRACRTAGDVSAKRVIVDRLVLEAQRRLAHSNDTAARIGADLGFDEPTNFTKFFRRETGLTPAAFRATVRAS